MVVALALLPLMISTVRAGEAAKLHTQAKNLLQERVEAMRNLPFHVPYSTGALYVDLLDIYFHDLANPSTNSKCDSASYNSTTKTYSCVLTTKLNFSGFTETISSQFLDKDRVVVAPVAGYDSQSTSGTDVPSAQMLGVTVTVSWKLYGKAKSFSSYSQIGNSAAAAPQTVAKWRTSAVSVDSTVDDVAPPTLAHLDVGLVTADAGVSTGATANSSATGAYANLSSGAVSTNQATGYLDAPPDQLTFTTVDGTSSGGVPCTSSIACFGPTRVSNVTGTAANGNPQVGSSAYPVTATSVKSGTATDRGFWFSNVPVGSTQLRLTRLGVQSVLSPPTTSNPTQLVRSVQSSPPDGYSVTCTGTPTSAPNTDFVKSTGYITTAGGAGHSVTTCTTATARQVDILPTNFAPDGVVQVTLKSASLLCNSTGSASAAPTAKWSATVRYWSYAIGGYVTLSFDQSSANPLTAALLTRGPGGVEVGRNGLEVLYLGDYIASWTSGTVSGGATTGTARQTDLTAVALSTQPTRDLDLLNQSGLNVAFGQLSCLAQDNR